MSAEVAGDLDLADIEVGQPPEGWTPDVTDEDPEPTDARDLDEDPEA